MAVCGLDQHSRTYVEWCGVRWRAWSFFCWIRYPQLHCKQLVVGLMHPNTLMRPNISCFWSVSLWVPKGFSFIFTRLPEDLNKKKTSPRITGISLEAAEAMIVLDSPSRRHHLIRLLNLSSQNAPSPPYAKSQPHVFCVVLIILRVDGLPRPQRKTEHEPQPEIYQKYRKYTRMLEYIYRI